MNDREFELLSRIEDDHWWFVGKRKILRALLDNQSRDGWLLDLGCGTGGVLRDWMVDRRCLGIDRSRLALQMCARRGFENLVCGDLDRLPLKRDSFETVMLLDVIEHLDDDAAFLETAAGLCAPGGRIVIAVPAFQFLWSQHDVTFEHRRRYSARQLDRVVRSAGFLPQRTTYTNALLFPIAAIWRLLSYRLGIGRFAPDTDFWKIPSWLNSLLSRIYDLEAWLLERFDLPAGLSVVCIARRPGGGARGGSVYNWRSSGDASWKAQPSSSK
jgi:SAM-dependent methyltransferase